MRLRFEAVYHRARVWFNGVYLGEHSGGYTPFEFDVTSRLQSTNTVVVAASNTYTIGAWWPWGGISRSVSLTVDAAVRIERQHVIATPDLSTGAGSVVNWVTLSNAGAAAKTVTVRSTYPWGTPTTTVTVPARGTAEARLDSTVAAGGYELWGLDRPTLYTCDTTVMDGSTLLHGKVDRFGFRKVEVRGTAVHLNGEQIRLNGYNRVGDDRVAGATEPTYLVRRDLDRMKAAGAGLMRIHHVPQTPELLDYADEIGMLLIEEIPVWGSGANLDPANETTRAELRDMIRRDYNHPSIVAWSVANEIRGASEEGRTYVREMIAYIKSTLDSTRLCTYVSNSFGDAATPAAEALQYTDFACINMYGGFAGGGDHVHGLYPDKPIFISEYSSDSFTFPTSREDVDFRTTSDAAATVFPGRPWIVGSSHWTFNDYRSSFGGTSPNQVRGWGIQNVWGQRKRAYAQLQATNAVVRGLGITTSSGLSLLTLNPRGALNGDAPARVLRGHRLAWQVTDAQGAVIDGRIVPLPDIAPGAATLQRAVRWTDPGTAVRQRLTLLAPSGHEIAAVTLDARVPSAPVIRQVIAANGAVRSRLRPCGQRRQLPGAHLDRRHRRRHDQRVLRCDRPDQRHRHPGAGRRGQRRRDLGPVRAGDRHADRHPGAATEDPGCGARRRRVRPGVHRRPGRHRSSGAGRRGSSTVRDFTTTLKGSVRVTGTADTVRIKGSNTVWSEAVPVAAPGSSPTAPSPPRPARGADHPGPGGGALRGDRHRRRPHRGPRRGVLGRRAADRDRARRRHRPAGERPVRDRGRLVRPAHPGHPHHTPAAGRRAGHPDRARQLHQRRRDDAGLVRGQRRRRLPGRRRRLRPGAHRRRRGRCDHPRPRRAEHGRGDRVSGHRRRRGRHQRGVGRLRRARHARTAAGHSSRPWTPPPTAPESIRYRETGTWLASSLSASTAPRAATAAPPAPPRPGRRRCVRPLPIASRCGHRRAPAARPRPRTRSRMPAARRR